MRIEPLGEALCAVTAEAASPWSAAVMRVEMARTIQLFPSVWMYIGVACWWVNVGLAPCVLAR